MEKRYVMLWNGGLYHSGDRTQILNKKNIFTLAELVTEFREEMGFANKQVRNSDELNGEHHLDTLEELFEYMIEAGDIARPHYLWEPDLTEHGDDYIAASLVKVGE